MAHILKKLLNSQELYKIDIKMPSSKIKKLRYKNTNNMFKIMQLKKLQNLDSNPNVSNFNMS